MVDRKTNTRGAQPVKEVHTDTVFEFIRRHSVPWAMIYTDGSSVYSARLAQPHDSVNHHAGEFARGKVHTNSVESFWAMLKRAHHSTYHKMSPKHLGLVHQRVFMP